MVNKILILQLYHWQLYHWQTYQPTRCQCNYLSPL